MIRKYYNLLDRTTIKRAIIFNQTFSNFLSKVLALNLFLQVQNIFQSTGRSLKNFIVNIQLLLISLGLKEADR